MKESKTLLGRRHKKIMNIFRRMKSEQKTFERYIKNKEEPCVAVLRKGYLIDNRCFPSFLGKIHYGGNDL